MVCVCPELPCASARAWSSKVPLAFFFFSFLFQYKIIAERKRLLFGISAGAVQRLEEGFAVPLPLPSHLQTQSMFWQLAQNQRLS